jgi:hypothetical protein
MPNLQPGDLVILKSVPYSLLRDLPEEDQAAIRSVVGKPVTFAGLSYRQAEIEFRDSHGDQHTIWVDTDRIQPVPKAA